MIKKENTYDCVVIGAGIGGLVCGNYLAKAGFKTLILEQNAFPGGYATSFKRGGFFFDSCAHSLGGCGEGGDIRQVLEELSLIENVSFKRSDPSDRIVTPDFTVDVSNDFGKTVQALSVIFSNEREKIEKFYDFLVSADDTKIISFRKLTFLQLLDSFFYNQKIKSFFSILLLGNLGLPASKISAVVSIKFFRQFIIDGGYYPEGGIQAFPDLLTKRFLEFGGRIILNKNVKKILFKSGAVQGVVTCEREVYKSNFVVSDCDALSTFVNLLGEKFLKNDFKRKLFKLEPSLSMFILYLGVVNKELGDFPIGTNIWKMFHYDIDKIYKRIIKGNFKEIDCFLLRRLNNFGSMICLVNMPYFSENFWKKHKSEFINIFISRIEELIPNFSKKCIFIDAATPITLEKHTSNHHGAAYGWSATPDQFIVAGCSIRSPIKNLFLTGHWSTVARGISGVSFLGRAVAKYILNRKEK